MRVLHLARYGSVRGGAETYVRALCTGQRAAGHTVALGYALEPDPTRAEVQAGFLAAALNDPGAGPDDALARAVRTFAPDVIHVHLPDIAWIAPWASTLAPVLLSVHDHRLNCPTGTKYWTAWNTACTIRPGVRCLGFNAVAHCGSLRANATLRPFRQWRSARAEVRGSGVLVQVFSEFMRVQVTRAGLDPARVGVTHYPAPNRPNEDPAPEAAANGDARPIVFASGRLNKEKGFHELLDAMSDVPTPVHLVIAGEGHERRNLELHSLSVPERHRVSFTGWLAAADVAAWLARAVVVAVPSVWPEPFGIAGLEAMAAGVPVVAFAVGGITEWLQHMETGIVVPPRAVATMGRALDALLSDPEVRARMSAAARERACKHFALADHVVAVDALYERAGATDAGATDAGAPDAGAPDAGATPRAEGSP